MTMQELERQVAAALHRRAEEAMNETDTDQLLRQLPSSVDRQKHDRRRALTVTGLVAVAAAIAVLAWISSQVPRADDPAPVDPDRSAENTAETFVDAYAAYDREQVAELLADADDVALWTDEYDDDHWQRGSRWLEAAGARILLDSCDALWSSPAGTHVSCVFDLHALHSEQLGLGPWPDNTLEFTVKDGKILEATQTLGNATNGFWPDLWNPFVRWLSRNHPAEAGQMFVDWPETRWVNDRPRGRQLWRQLSQEYADARSGARP